NTIMRTSLLAILATFAVCALAVPGGAKEASIKRDDMMGFGDISAIDTLGGIGLGKRSQPWDEGRLMLARYRELMRERNPYY
ncbi:hypothetical protein PFISCL1PPCAC_6790, partial [Pristionchus fissidentatus]